MLLDTSGLLGLHHKPEPFHALACSIYGDARVRLTHSYVLAEFVAPLSPRNGYIGSAAFEDRAQFLNLALRDNGIQTSRADEHRQMAEIQNQIGGKGHHRPKEHGSR